MKELVEKAIKLKGTDVRKEVDARLKSFLELGKKSSSAWFSELCFCILTANSKARTAMAIQEELGARGFCDCSKDDIRSCIIRHKHRFHNNKTEYIMEARKIPKIKSAIEGMDDQEAREWLVANVKGLGYKEASHFLRNVGYINVSILDRHILNLMVENRIIKEKPKSLGRKQYMEIEKKYMLMAKMAGMSPVELDMYLWYMKTGEVLK